MAIDTLGGAPTGALPFRRVVIGANAHADLVAALASARPDLELRGSRFGDVSASDLSWADAYVGFKRPPLPSMGNVRWVHCTGAGVDAWLMPTELDPHILLTRTSESFGPPIAEWALGRALMFAQQLRALDASQRAHEWAPREAMLLRGTNAVVVGMGDVGAHVSRLFAALGCSVTGVSRTGSHGAIPVTSIESALSNADWIVITLPLTAATHHLFDAALLSRCNGAVLINAGRGAVIDEAALPQALANGWIRGAALDVFEVEPLPAASPLWSDERVVVSPHMSGITTTAGAAAGFLECLRDLDAGRVPRWVVDRERQY